MTQVRRLKPRRALEAERLVAKLRDLLPLLDLDTGQAASLDQALGAYAATLERWKFMQINGDREAEILDHIRRHAKAKHEAADVLTAVRNSLGFRDQRTQLTQAEIAKQLGLDRANAGRAFRALQAAGAILNPLPSGRSQTWEVDANFATRLGLDERAVKAAEQAQWLASQTSAGDNSAEEPMRRRAQLRAIPGGMEGIE